MLFGWLGIPGFFGLPNRPSGQEPAAISRAAEVALNFQQGYKQWVMKWSRMNYPEPMRSLREDVRLRAIDIANKLVKKGVEENCAILAAMDRAAAWEHHPGKPARRAEERRNYRERHKKA